MNFFNEELDSDRRESVQTIRYSTSYDWFAGGGTSAERSPSFTASARRRVSADTRASLDMGLAPEGSRLAGVWNASGGGSSNRSSFTDGSYGHRDTLVRGSINYD